MRKVELLLAALTTLLPLLLAGFFPERIRMALERLGLSRLLGGSMLLLVVPYLLISAAFGTFRLPWLLVYLALPAIVIPLLGQAKRLDPGQRGNWRDYVVLGALGLAVDLRWLEPAWPPHLAVFNKILLLDLGLIGWLGIRRLDGIGFDLRLRWRDLRTGGREFLFYAPGAIAIGLALGFLHPHRGWPKPLATGEALLFTFFFIAVPEELFFRGWLQNFLERRLGRASGLGVSAMLFGLAHFNKRAVHFNWRYVLLAALAGVFYGRAWRRERRVAASAVTHTLVDTVWSLTLR